MALRIRQIGLDATRARNSRSKLSPECSGRRSWPRSLTAAPPREARCKLPASTVLLLCVAMNLYSNDCLTHVFFRLVSRMRWLLGDRTRCG